MRLTALQGFGPIIPLLLDSVLRRNDWLGSGAGLYRPFRRRPHLDLEAAMARLAVEESRHGSLRPSRDEAETDGFIRHAATEAHPARIGPAVDAEKSGCFFGERAGKR
jgi:hypothetical protein